MLYSDNMLIPKTRTGQTWRMAWMNYVYNPVPSAKIVKAAPYISPVKGTGAELEKIAPELASSPLVKPPGRSPRPAAHLPRRWTTRRTGVQPDLPGRDGSLSSDGRHRSGQRETQSLAPYLLVAPGVLWLLLFYVVPAIALARTSVSAAGAPWWDGYVRAFTDYGDSLPPVVPVMPPSRPCWRSCWDIRWPT